MSSVVSWATGLLWAENETQKRHEMSKLVQTIANLVVLGTDRSIAEDVP